MITQSIIINPTITQKEMIKAEEAARKRMTNDQTNS